MAKGAHGSRFRDRRTFDMRTSGFLVSHMMLHSEAFGSAFMYQLLQRLGVAGERAKLLYS